MTILTVMWRVFTAYFFYPIMIGLFLWVYISDAHWAFGLLIIVAILLLDRTWLRIAQNIRQMLKNRKS